MQNRVSKAVDLKLLRAIKIPGEKDCPKSEDGELYLVVKRQRAFPDNKTEESFEIIPQRDWDVVNWATKVTFDLNQIYYRENKFIESNENKVFNSVSESILMGN
jgi:hypothetical protein